MNYKELIDALRNFTYWCGSSQNYQNYAHDIHPKTCDDAADAIEDLLAENASKEAEIERLKEQIEADSQLESGLGNANTLCGIYKADNVLLRAELDAAMRFIRHIDSEYGRYINDTGFEKWRGMGGENDG